LAKEKGEKVGGFQLAGQYNIGRGDQGNPVMCWMQSVNVDLQQKGGGKKKTKQK